MVTDEEMASFLRQVNEFTTRLAEVTAPPTQDKRTRTSEAMFKGPTGIELRLDDGSFVHLCFSDEVDHVIDGLYALEPDVVEHSGWKK